MVVFDGLVDGGKGVGVQLQAVVQARPEVRIDLLVPEEVLDVASRARDVAPHELDGDEAELSGGVGAQAIRGRLEGGPAEAIAEVGVVQGDFPASLLDERGGGRGFHHIVRGGCDLRGEEGRKGEEDEEEGKLEVHHQPYCVSVCSWGLVCPLGDIIVGDIL